MTVLKLLDGQQHADGSMGPVRALRRCRGWAGMTRVPPHRPRCAPCAFLCVRGDEPLQATSPAIFRSASSNTAAGWPPLIRYLPSTTTAGTAVMPRDRHRASASRTSAA